MVKSILKYLSVVAVAGTIGYSVASYNQEVVFEEKTKKEIVEKNVVYENVVVKKDYVFDFENNALSELEKKAAQACEDYIAGKEVYGSDVLMCLKLGLYTKDDLKIEDYSVVFQFKKDEKEETVEAEKLKQIENIKSSFNNKYHVDDKFYNQIINENMTLENLRELKQKYLSDEINSRYEEVRNDINTGLDIDLFDRVYISDDLKLCIKKNECDQSEIEKLLQQKQKEIRVNKIKEYQSQYSYDYKFNSFDEFVDEAYKNNEISEQEYNKLKERKKNFLKVKSLLDQLREEGN